MSNHWYPQDTKSPLKINPDGTQSPNPNYTGSNGYKKLPNGKLVPKNPSVPAPVRAAGGFLGTLGTWVNGLTAINAGYTAGMAVDSQRTGQETGFTSGRGEGRRGAVETGGGGHIPVLTYADGRSVPRASNLPASAKDTSQYPEGVSTGYRSRREGLDATYPDRAKPAPTPPTTPTTPTVPTRETAPPTPGQDANAKGTQMGSKGALANFDALATRLSDGYGVEFHFDSDQLPTSKGHQVATYSGWSGDEMPEYVNYGGEAVLASEVFGNDGKGGYLGTALLGDYADRSDVSRAIDFNMSGDDLPAFWGDEEKIENPPKGGAESIGAAVAGGSADKKGGEEKEGRTNWMDGKAGQRAQRNRAFLDYDGPGGSMMALRQQEAAQGTIRQNGRTYGKNAEGKWTRLSDEAAQELKSDRTLHAGSSYVTDNAYTSKPAEEHAKETLSKHIKHNVAKISHGEALDLTKDIPEDMPTGVSEKPKSAGVGDNSGLYDPDNVVSYW